MSRAKYLWDTEQQDWVPAGEKKAVAPKPQTNIVRLFGKVKRRQTGRYVWHKGDWVSCVEPKKAKGVQIVRDLSAYVSPVCDADGKHPVIDGRAAQREDLKRNNCRIKEPSETLRRAGVPSRPEPVITKAMERTAVEAYERAMARDNR